MIFGAVEAGGTKFVVGVGTGAHDVRTVSIPTTTPSETIGRAIDCLRAQGDPAAIGIASFGPVDLDEDSPAYGYITNTPKAGWANTDLAGAFRHAFHLPIGFDTDVNAAALAEMPAEASSCLYLTIGTGIGGGAIVIGKSLRGISHPEMGHVRVPRHPHDDFAGVCPFHGDCLEGMASGPAIEGRWKARGETLPASHPAWELEVHYLATAIANFTLTLSPEHVVLGGGVMQQEHLFDPIRAKVNGMLNGYAKTPPIEPPTLGNRSGIVGALALAALRYYDATT